MELYYINNNPVELIAGTSNKVLSSYAEAVNIIEGKDPSKSIKSLRLFGRSIEKVISKQNGRNKTIISSAGNIKSLRQYDMIVDCLEKLKNLLPSDGVVKSLQTVHDSLVNFQPFYSDSYRKKAMIIMLEYEALAMMLINGITMIITSKVEANVKPDGAIELKTTNKPIGGILATTINNAATIITKKDHYTYLQELLKVQPSDDKSITEAGKDPGDTVKDVIDSIGTIFQYARSGIAAGRNILRLIIRSAFGIIPIIRSILYLHYKGKADMIGVLEDQAKFLLMNIDQLKRDTTVDETKKAVIIRKQQAYVDRYKRKAEKLRIELIDNEKDAKAELEANPVTPTADNSNDDLQL